MWECGGELICARFWFKAKAKVSGLEENYGSEVEVENKARGRLLGLSLLDNKNIVHRQTAEVRHASKQSMDYSLDLEPLC